jgi:hypothetical protein
MYIIELREGILARLTGIKKAGSLQPAGRFPLGSFVAMICSFLGHHRFYFRKDGLRLCFLVQN